MADMVNHPPHYKNGSGPETIDIIKWMCADLVGIQAVDTANVIKYLSRWYQKNGLEDLYKARWYLNHLIENVEEKGYQQYTPKSLTMTADSLTIIKGVNNEEIKDI